MKAILIFLFFPVIVLSQPMPLPTSFHVLSIPGSARGWAMGNSGIASSIANQSLVYNVAKAAFTQHRHQGSLHYMPWLPGVNSDARLIHAGYLGSLGSAVMGVSVHYLHFGTLAIRDAGGATLGLYKAGEYSIAGSYGLQIGSQASLGTTLRYFAQVVPGVNANNRSSVCGDISYYQSIPLSDALHTLSIGAVVNNLGANIDLPTAAGVGLSYQSHSPDNNALAVTVEASKLLKEGWRGTRISCGAEYGVAESFFMRGGVHLEHVTKGNRKFFSLGAGYRGFVSDQHYGIDFFYLIPFGKQGAVSPFQNSFGFTLSLNIGHLE